MKQEVMIVGGPRDGEIVPFVGQVMQEPVMPDVRFQAWEPDALPVGPTYTVREYILCQWSDQSGPTRGFRYVLRDMAKQFGAS
jgi:hypothetical protein